MLTQYFLALTKQFQKKKTAAKSGTKSSAKKSSKKSSSSAPSGGLTVDKVHDLLEGMVPSGLAIDRGRPINTGGFSPEGSDLLIYRRYCRDILPIMNGYVPYELLQGTVFVIPSLTKATLVETLNRVATVKKINRFAEQSESEALIIPSFIIAGESDYDPMDLKNDVINYYMAKSVDHACEIDILLVLNRCLLMKNWREKRSFIGLETADQSLMWFFILMNEYLEGVDEREMDFRGYIRQSVVYREF